MERSANANHDDTFSQRSGEGLLSKAGSDAGSDKSASAKERLMREREAAYLRSQNKMQA